MILVYIINAILFFYLLFILWIILGMNRVKPFRFNNTNNNNNNNHFFSIIIPFRNEALHLYELLNSIKTVNYDKNKFEVLLIDDESSDNSLSIIGEFINENPLLSLKCYPNKRHSNSPKKDAITTAIEHSNYDWIITSDADCVIQKETLSILDQFIVKEKPLMVVGNVNFDYKKSFLKQFQYYNWLSLNSFTLNGFGRQHPTLASGAFLAYNKKSVLDIGLFKNNNDFSSGDDIFLLHSMYDAYPEKIKYLLQSQAAITTKALNNWTLFFNQQKRWLSKSDKIQDKTLLISSSIVFITNVSWILGLVLLFFGIKTKTLLIYLIFKPILDNILLLFTAQKYRVTIHPIYGILSILFYPFFTLILGVTAFISDFIWKDRRFDK